MSLKIFNTLSQSKELFEPVTPGKVGIYLCGPTVYKPSHIGHAVGPIIFDTIKRYLAFKGYQVTWVVNITDVEDKLITEAQAQGCTSQELAEKVTANYLEAMNKLGVRGIDKMPKASEFIGEIIKMCQRLIDKGAAYVSNGDVYFDITADDDYGKLSHRKVEDQQAGGRDLAGEEKRNPGDFALWKASKPQEPDEVKFDSPWGKGRPGWHIECSAMSAKILGETFDIHGGGKDLIFPHHENEIAQSETCFDKPFVKYWMHNGLTRFNTKKISKSDAEMAKRMDELVLSELLNKHSPELIRYFVLSTHYRRPIEFSDEELEAKKKGLDAFYRLFERIERVSGQDPYAGGDTLEKVSSVTENDNEKMFVHQCLEHQVRFMEVMDDDFNTGAAVGVLFDLCKTINRYMDDEKVEINDRANPRKLASSAVQTLRSLTGLMGLFERRPAKSGIDDSLVNELMDVLIAVRAEARKNKHYDLADLVREKLNNAGIVLEDLPDGTIWRRTD
ncbi:MAG: cysteine--tRNA ligase [Planctomycetota bacterium]|jgi:cysteinyl-tRNA synthetase